MLLNGSNVLCDKMILNKINVGNGTAKKVVAIATDPWNRLIFIDYVGY